MIVNLVNFVKTAIAQFYSVVFSSITIDIPFPGGNMYTITLHNIILGAIFMIILYKGIQLITGKDTSRD